VNLQFGEFISTIWNGDITENDDTECHIMIDTYGNKSSSHVSLGAPFLGAGYVRLDFEVN
jgi:hypothetical protein